MNGPQSRRSFLKSLALGSSVLAVPGLAGDFDPSFASAAVSPASSVHERGSAANTTLIIASPNTPQSLDHEFDVSLGTIDSVGALYDSLLQYAKIHDPKVPSVWREDTADHPNLPSGLNLKGKLAERWEVSRDGLVGRFFLRQGVKSNWGNELTAEDVKWTWDRHLTLRGLGAFQTAALGIYHSNQVRVDGRYAVSFHVDKPNPLLLKQQVNLANPIYDSKKCKEVASSSDPWAHNFLSNNSAGFGPYVISQLTRGQQAVFTARKDYYGPKPYFKTVIFKEVATSAARTSLLQGGAVDIAQFLLPREYNSLKRAPGVSVDTVAASYMIWIELNAKMHPFDNVTVRQAMNYAFPHESVLRTVYYHLATQLTAPMPSIYPDATSRFWRYKTNLAKAKAFLAQAGFPRGFKTTLSYNAGDPVQEPIAIEYQTNLRSIGVDLVLNKLPADTFYNYVTKRTQPMTFYVDSPWVPDPGYSTQLYFQSQSYVDYSNYHNPTVDSLIHKGLQTTDAPLRKNIYTRVQQIIMNEAPWVFIAYPNFTLAHRSNVKGWTYYTSNNLRFQDLYRV